MGEMSLPARSRLYEPPMISPTALALPIRWATVQHNVFNPVSALVPLNAISARVSRYLTWHAGVSARRPETACGCVDGKTIRPSSMMRPRGFFEISDVSISTRR